MASSGHPLHQNSLSYIMSCRRPPVMRRTATTVLAGGPRAGWHNPYDLEALRTAPDFSADDRTAPPESVLHSAAAQPLGLSSSDSAQAHTATTTSTGRRKSNARARQRPKQTEQSTTVIDLGASIIPICTPGTGTPPPPQSYASSSSLTRSDFDTGASSRMEEDEEEEEEYLTAIVGKRSRARSITSQQSTRLPISPPVTSPNTSTYELPISTPAIKRAREGREPVRRKRRKTTSSTVSTSTRGGEEEAVSLVTLIKHPQEKQPPQRKGWKGWVMVSDTEGSDNERPDIPPVILEKRTRSGRDFDQELPPLQRRARSRASTRTDSVAPLSSASIAT